MKTTTAETAKAIRAELKKEFPSIKFSVKSQRGSAVIIEYTDGVLSSKVKAIVDKYQYGHFNGMEDIYEISNSRNDIPQAQYIFVTRNQSEAVQNEILKEIQTKYQGCENLGLNDYATDHGQYISAMVHRLFCEREYLPTEVVKTTAPVTEVKEGDQILANRDNALLVGRVKQVTEKAVKMDYANEPIFASGSNQLTVFTWSAWIPKSVLFIDKVGTPFESISIKKWFLDKIKAYGIQKYFINEQGLEVTV